jgi:hypothetical protein
MDATSDEVTTYHTVNPATTDAFRVGDWVIFNDEGRRNADPTKRRYEVAQIIGPGSDGDPVPTGTIIFRRGTGDEFLGAGKCEHLAGVRFYRLEQKALTYSVTRAFFRTPGVPGRVEAPLPSACVVAAQVAVANHYGYGPTATINLCRHNEPFMPGMRTCNGGAYVFQVPGPLTVQDTVAIPLKIQDAASVRCVYGYLQEGTSDGNISVLVKRSRDGGATWEPLELMGIPAHAPDPYTTSYDALVAEGYGPPSSRRLPYADYGLALAQAVSADPANLQTVSTSSYGANQLGLQQWTAIHIDPGGPNEEYTYVHSADPVAQTITAIFRRSHSAGERIRPTVWPTPVLSEEDDIAFDVLAVGSPNPGSDLTIVIQT